MSHESNDQKRRRLDRTDDRDQGSLVAYEDESGNATTWTGDEEAPYVKALSVAGSPIEVQGDIANDAVDSGNPVKIGGLAVDGTTAALSGAVAAGDRVNALFDLYGRLGVLPWVIQTDEATLLSSAALAAAGAYSATNVIDVQKWRKIALTIRYAPGGANGYPHVIPIIAKTATQPAQNADSWSTMTERDAVASNNVLAGVMPSGQIITAQPSWAIVTNRQLVLRTEAGTAAGNRIREDIVLSIENVKWLYFIYAEVGLIATPGTLGLRYNLAL